MLKAKHGVAVALIAAFGVAGCHQTPATPTGQVAATVNGQEITEKQIDLELNGARFPNAKAEKLARSHALQTIVARKILAQAAQEQGLDKTPEFSVRQQQQTELLLVQSLQAKFLKDVPAPTKEDVDAYITAHPEMFAEQKIYDVDQIRFPLTQDRKILEQIQHLNTIDEVESMLKQQNIPHLRNDATLNSSGMDPKLIAAIDKLPPHAAFMVPAQGSLLVNAIKGEKVAPLSGDAAAQVATRMLLLERQQATLNKAFGQIMAKAFPKVKMNKTYQDAAPKLGGAKGQAPASSSPASSAPH